MNSPLKDGVEELAEQVQDAVVEATPKPKKKRTGHNKGLTKKEKPKLANRLPREKGGLIVPMGDGLTPFERALVILGPRVGVTKSYYTLDGKPCNATDILRLAGQDV